MNALAIAPAAPMRRAIDDRVFESLELLADQITTSRPGRWQLTLAGEHQARTTVAIDADWLIVERELHALRLTRIALTRRWGWRALDEQLELPAGVRPVLAAGGMRVRIRGERPLTHELSDARGHLGRWIHAAVAAGAAFKIGARVQLRTNLDIGSTRASRKSADVDIAALCEQAGWPVAARGDTKDAVVALPARDDAICHAVVTRAGEGVRLRVALAAIGRESPACQAAAALALLRTTGSVRMVRATATRTGKGIGTGLEIRLEPPLDAQLFKHAFAALAVAHQQVSKELGVLAFDDALARAYLSVQGVR